MAAKLWEDIKKGAKDTISFVTEKTEELTTIGRLKVEIASVRRKMEAQFKELGHYVFEKIEKGEAATLADDEKVKSYITTISTLEKELKAKEEELQTVGKKGGKEAGEQPAGEIESTEAAPETSA